MRLYMKIFQRLKLNSFTNAFVVNLIRIYVLNYLKLKKSLHWTISPTITVQMLILFGCINLSHLIYVMFKLWYVVLCILYGNPVIINRIPAMNRIILVIPIIIILNADRGEQTLSKYTLIY